MTSVTRPPVTSPDPDRPGVFSCASPRSIARQPRHRRARRFTQARATPPSHEQRDTQRGAAKIGAERADEPCGIRLLHRRPCDQPDDEQAPADSRGDDEEQDRRRRRMRAEIEKQQREERRVFGGIAVRANELVQRIRGIGRTAGRGGIAKARDGHSESEHEQQEPENRHAGKRDRVHMDGTPGRS